MEIIFTNPYIYLSGYIVAYILFKVTRNKMGTTNDWGIVWATALISLFSWITVMALLFFIALVFISKLKLKPPRWL